MATVVGDYRCVSCHLGFPDPDAHRAHYKDELHRFNLKRKVVNLPPISQVAFDAKMNDSNKAAEPAGKVSRECVFCKKHFASVKQFEMHLQSKKHKDAERRAADEAGDGSDADDIDLDHEIALEASLAEHLHAHEQALPSDAAPASPASALVSAVETLSVAAAHTPASVPSPVVANDVDESTLTEDQIIERRLANAPRLTSHDCLFCRHKSSDPENNVNHMANEHGFFVPDVEYLSDLHGLLSYLGDKVALGYTCLYCHATYRSMNAVQDHMRDRSHCKLKYEEGFDLDEFEDFYDFTSSYAQIEDGVTEVADPSSSALIVVAAPRFEVASNGMELQLKDGRVIGHRSLLRYYKQHYASSQPFKRDRVITQYRAIGWKGTNGNGSELPKAAVLARNRHEMLLGYKANGLFQPGSQIGLGGKKK